VEGRGEKTDVQIPATGAQDTLMSRPLVEVVYTPHDTRASESWKSRINTRNIYVEDHRTMTPTTTKFLLTASNETSRDVESNKNTTRTTPDLPSVEDKGTGADRTLNVIFVASETRRLQE
jgi:hypothetical protein